MRRLAAVAVAAAGVTFSACASQPHALQYVVLPNHEALRPDLPETPPPEVALRQSEENPEYPIFEPDDVGVGGAGCTVGLIGTRCELGILGAEVPLEERTLLPPDGEVIAEPLPGPADARPTPPLPEWEVGDGDSKPLQKGRGR